jgi:hypothetical protein
MHVIRVDDCGNLPPSDGLIQVEVEAQWPRRLNGMAQRPNIRTVSLEEDLASRYHVLWHLQSLPSAIVAAFVEEEPAQRALIRVQVEHPMINAAGDHHILRPSKLQLASCVADGAKGKEIVKRTGVLPQRLGVLVEEVSKGSWVGLEGSQPPAPLVTAPAVLLLIE